jgi:hypothetical protein
MWATRRLNSSSCGIKETREEGKIMITPEEALLIFQKWRDAGTTLYCDGSFFSGFGFVIQGRVSSVVEREARIDSLDKRCCLVVRIDEMEAFEYGDLEHIPESIRSKIPSESRELPVVVAAIPLRGGVLGLQRDKLVFLECPPEF